MNRAFVALSLGCLVAAVVLTLAPALAGPFHAYDDATYILANRLVTAPGEQPLLDMLLTPTVGYVVPVTVAMQALLYGAGGGEAMAFHAAALLLHLSAALLVWWLARRLSADMLVATALAALFALHPLVVEPVAWATGLKDLLASVCALGACALLLRERERPWGAMALCVLAVLSKPTAALLPLGLLAGWWAARERPARWLRPLVVAAVVTLGVGVLSKISHDVVIADPARVPGGPLSALLALGYQAAHLVWPAALHPQYFIDRAAGFSDAHAFIGLVVLAGIAVVVVWAVRGKRREQPHALMLGALGLAAYLPVSHLLAFPRYVADSYLYLPLAALLLALAPTLARFAKRSAGARALLIAVLLLLCVPCALRSRAQVARWRSPLALWGPLAAAHPTDARPWLLLAQGLRFAGDAKRAASAYGQAFARQRREGRLTNYARALFEAGRLDDAECVIIEDAVYGKSQRRALANLALLAIKHARHTPRWPHYTRAALARAVPARWPAALRAAAAKRRAQLGAAAAALPIRATWPAGRCAALRTARLSFARWQASY
ncbi:MAG: hypothetical protein KC503_38640 [Myxococcales bacterium]|nr:hypothetical protein [Myxococcales bacterium]